MSKITDFLSVVQQKDNLEKLRPICKNLDGDILAAIDDTGALSLKTKIYSIDDAILIADFIKDVSK